MNLYSPEKQGRQVVFLQMRKQKNHVTFRRPVGGIILKVVLGF